MTFFQEGKDHEVYVIEVEGDRRKERPTKSGLLQNLSKKDQGTQLVTKVSLIDRN